MLYAVAHYGIEGETFFAVFLKRLTDGVGQTAAPCEYPSVIGRVVEMTLFERGHIYVLAVDERLQFFESDDGIDELMYLFLTVLRFLRRARSDEDHFAVALHILDVLRKHRHRRKVAAYMLREIGELLLDVFDECGTTGASKESFLRKL